MQSQQYAPVPPPKIPHANSLGFFSKHSRLASQQGPPPAQYSHQIFVVDDFYYPTPPAPPAHHQNRNSYEQPKPQPRSTYQESEVVLPRDMPQQQQQQQQKQTTLRRSRPATPPKARGGFDARPSNDDFRGLKFHEGVGGAYRGAGIDVRGAGYHPGPGSVERKQKK